MMENDAGMNSAVKFSLRVNRCGAVMVMAKKLAVPLLPVGAFVRLHFRLSAGELWVGRADVGQDLMWASALADHTISLVAAALQNQGHSHSMLLLVVVGISNENSQLKFPI